MQSYLKSTRVKVCGITSVDDAIAVANAGADAIGCVFYEPSPRSVTIDAAAQIVRAVGPLVTTVGLFVNAPASYINEVLKHVPLQLLQFHGDETVDFCEQFERPYIKAIRMRPNLDLTSAIESYPSALAVLLDAYQKGVPGGTGETFDWDRVPKTTQPSGNNVLHTPIILAGGLSPDNVQAAIQATSPYAVDVSGGVEQSHGIKDQQKVIDFIKNTRCFE